MVRRLVMLRVGTTGAEPLRPIARYIRRRLLRPSRARSGRVPRRAAGNDDHVLQPAPPHGGVAIRKLDRRRGDDEDDADAEAQDALHG
jgi:hypothetical protein